MKVRIETPPRTSAFGGELPLGCDALVDECLPLPSDCLAFSHGRAALAWLCRRLGPFNRVVLSAYTCPTVPEFFEAYGVSTTFVDAIDGRWEEAIEKLSGRVLVLVPAFLGHDPNVDLAGLAGLLVDRGILAVDAAQTAFGHETIAVPEGVVILACPRKCVALGDGAILRWSGVTEADRRSILDLPWAAEIVGAKLAVRALCVSRSPAIEPDMLVLNAYAERNLPSTVHRMSDASLWSLSWIDRAAHAQTRWRNWRALAEALDDCVEILHLSGGTPFNLSILTSDRDAVLHKLRCARVFATALWPGSVRDRNDHPVAENMAHRLIGLPVDQRYGEADMGELALLVRRSLVN